MGDNVAVMKLRRYRKSQDRNVSRSQLESKLFCNTAYTKTLYVVPVVPIRTSAPLSENSGTVPGGGWGVGDRRGG